MVCLFEVTFLGTGLKITCWDRGSWKKLSGGGLFLTCRDLTGGLEQTLLGQRSTIAGGDGRPDIHRSRPEKDGSSDSPRADAGLSWAHTLPLSRVKTLPWGMGGPHFIDEDTEAGVKHVARALQAGEANLGQAPRPPISSIHALIIPLNGSQCQALFYFTKFTAASTGHTHKSQLIWLDYFEAHPSPCTVSGRGAQDRG